VAMPNLKSSKPEPPAIMSLELLFGSTTWLLGKNTTRIKSKSLPWQQGIGEGRSAATPVQVEGCNCLVGHYQCRLPRDVLPEELTLLKQATADVNGVGAVPKVDLHHLHIWLCRHSRCQNLKQMSNDNKIREIKKVGLCPTF
jgi:hypothetical protein